MRWQPHSTPAAALRGRKSDQVGEQVGEQVGVQVEMEAAVAVAGAVAVGVDVEAGCCPSVAMAVDATCGQAGTV
jgi:hypothetical protein